MVENVSKLDVRVTPDIDPRTGEVVTLPQEVLYQAMVDAGWSEDPGTGKAILTPLGSEIVSPRPVSPPIGYVSEPSVMDRLAQMLEARIAQLKDDDVIEESEEEMEDFDVPDLEDIRFSYNVVEMVHEVPAIPRTPAKASEAGPVPDGGAKPDGDVRSQV